MVPVRALILAATVALAAAMTTPAAASTPATTPSVVPPAAARTQTPPAATTPATATPAAPVWTPDVEAARAYIRTRPGRVTFSLLEVSSGRRWGERAWEPVASASLLKPLLMAAYLRRGTVRERALTAGERGRLGPMIRRSANEPADGFVTALGADAIARTARAAGMGSARLVRPWGNTRTTARAQIALFAGLPELLPTRHRAYALRLLTEVTPSQRWGIGAVRVPGWRLHLKGGWGSGTGSVDHQTALFVRGEERVALAITTVGNGTHARGKATLRGVASRLLRGLGKAPPAAAATAAAGPSIR